MSLAAMLLNDLKETGTELDRVLAMASSADRQARKLHADFAHRHSTGYWCG